MVGRGEFSQLPLHHLYVHSKRFHHQDRFTMFHRVGDRWRYRISITASSIANPMNYDEAILAAKIGIVSKKEQNTPVKLIKILS